MQGDNILIVIGNKPSFMGLYTIKDDQLVYDRKRDGYCYLLIDRENRRLMMDESNPFTKASDDSSPAGTASGGNPDSRYSGRDTHPFESDGDVLDFTSGKFYNSEGTYISLKFGGMYVNGHQSQTFAPVVTYFRGMYARIRVNTIPSGSFDFTVDKANGTITDMEGGVWRKK